MALTVQKTGTTAWQQVADGAGNATMTCYSSTVRWAIGNGAVAPTLTAKHAGHVLPEGENVSLDLAAGERLWIKGIGSVYVTATNPL